MKKLILLISTIVFMMSITACHDNDNKEKNNNYITVGVFDGNGASPICVIETQEALKIDRHIRAFELSAGEIMNGALDTIDVLVFPGGSGSKELNNLGELAAEKVKYFVQQQGKGIVGICAGGYLLSTTPTYPSLRLLSVMNYDRQHYSRGRGLIQVELTQPGLKIFPELKGHKVFLQYYDGPILVARDSNELNYTELAKYVTDIHANPGIPSGITPGKSFMVFEEVGKGRIAAIGGHPEATPGLRWMLPRLVHLVSDNKIIKYDQKWYNPDQYKAEYMFTPDKIKLEKQLFWDLFSDTAQIKIKAIKQLFYQMHSRPAVRWAIGLLRDKDPQVRITSAKILADAEYTWAIPDLHQALKNETDPQVKRAIEHALQRLKY